MGLVKNSGAGSLSCNRRGHHCSSAVKVLDRALELHTSFLSYKSHCMNYCNSASLNFPLFKRRECYFFFKSSIVGDCFV